MIVSNQELAQRSLIVHSNKPHPVINVDDYIEMSVGVPDGDDVCLPPKAPFFTVSGGTTALHSVYVRPMNEGFKPNSPSPLRQSMVNRPPIRPPLRRRLTSLLLLQDIPIPDLCGGNDGGRPQLRRREAIRLASTRTIQNTQPRRPVLAQRGVTSPSIEPHLNNPPPEAHPVNPRRSLSRRLSDYLHSRTKSRNPCPAGGLGIVAPGVWDHHALFTVARAELAAEGVDVSSLPEIRQGCVNTGRRTQVSRAPSASSFEAEVQFA